MDKKLETLATVHTHTHTQILFINNKNAICEDGLLMMKKIYRKKNDKS